MLLVCACRHPLTRDKVLTAVLRRVLERYSALHLAGVRGHLVKDLARGRGGEGGGEGEEEVSQGWAERHYALLSHFILAIKSSQAGIWFSPVHLLNHPAQVTGTDLCVSAGHSLEDGIVYEDVLLLFVYRVGQTRHCWNSTTLEFWKRKLKSAHMCSVRSVTRETGKGTRVAFVQSQETRHTGV